MTVVPLSYMVRQAELEVCRHSFADWLAAVTNTSPSDFSDWTFAHWTRDHHQFDCHFQGDPDRPISIVFDYAGFDPDLSDWDYGTPELSPPVLDDRPNHTYLFDNRQGITPLTGSLSESVVYGQRRTVTTSNEWHIDMGAKEGFTLGGEKAGGSFEAEVQENWGIKSDASTAEAENTDRTESEAINYTVSPGHATLATLATPRVRSKQTFDVNGVLDCGITFRLWLHVADMFEGSEWGPIYDAESTTVVTDGDSPYFEFKLGSFDDLLALADGYNVDYPEATSPIKYDALYQLIEDRTVVWSGTINRSYQTASEYQFTDVPPDQVKEAIQEHAIPTERRITT